MNADDLTRAFEARTPGSKKLWKEACRYLPGGDTRSSAHFDPYPVAMVHGAGCRLIDVDGHEYVDFMNNFTSLVHGHAHAPTVRAVQEQMAVGSAYAAPSPTQVELARLLCERIPSVEELRFTSSGSEATQMAVRAARAFTGKQKIVKMEGGYHGSHDLGEMSLVPVPGKAGPVEDPETVLTDRSLSEKTRDEVITTPFNRPDVTRRQLEERGDEIAAVLLEPMLGGLGMIPPEPGVLAELREITEEHEVLLIFDEVITLRVASGGMQEREGVVPDLTAMGKIIGGGLPIGAFGGRREILELFHPGRRGTIMHASTFSGNALSMAAGLAAMNALPAGEIDRINGLGARLREGFEACFRDVGLRGQATGVGSLSHVHLAGERVRDARASVTAAAHAGPLTGLLHLGMVRRGVFPAPRSMYATSTAMGTAEVDAAVATFGDVLRELRPLAEEQTPHLVV